MIDKFYWNKGIPKDNEFVLIIDTQKNYRLGKIKNEVFRTLSGNYVETDNILAWAYIPEYNG